MKAGPKVEPAAHSVYRLYGADNELLYVGCTFRPVERVTQNHARTQPWWNEVAYAWFDHYETKQEAAEVERRIIELDQPRYNRKYGVPGHNGRPPKPRLVETRKLAP